MVKEFENNWAIILGGSSGLGYAAALKLAQEGMDICIIHRNSRSEMHTIEKDFEKIRKTGQQFIAYNMDLNNEEKRKLVLNELKDKMTVKGKVKCLLHSIAKGNLKPLIHNESPNLSKEDFEITMRNMAFSLWEWVEAIFSMALFDADARILAFTSEGSKRPMKHYAAVSAAKASLEAMIRSIAVEFADLGIRANCIQAGMTDTRSLRMIPHSDEIVSANKERNPFKRLTQPLDIANVVYLMCKKEAAWINGTIIVADGGESLK